MHKCEELKSRKMRNGQNKEMADPGISTVPSLLGVTFLPPESFLYKQPAPNMADHVLDLLPSPKAH